MSKRIVPVACLLLLAACAPKEETVVQPEETAVQVAPTPVVADENLVAVAQMQPAAGRTVSGTVTFTENGDVVEIRAEINGAPAGNLGIHLHEVGDCSAADFTSAGGHFNPAGHPHGAPTSAERHAGDFGNITISEDGSGILQLTSSDLTVAEGPSSVVGRAVVLHEKTDDLATQPTGNAGGRIACGVVVREGAVSEPAAAPADAAPATPADAAPAAPPSAN
jgi:Cu-Zn family superoxide dismutase